ncbi:hypothetical protein C8R43DRAFT_942843 [Mycena crocata]|nr:hypothetical protein C8R43DRAFT_942843 [Mycena crocata]
MSAVLARVEAAGEHRGQGAAVERCDQPARPVKAPEGGTQDPKSESQRGLGVVSGPICQTGEYAGQGLGFAGKEEEEKEGVENVLVGHMVVAIAFGEGGPEQAPDNAIEDVIPGDVLTTGEGRHQSEEVSQKGLAASVLVGILVLLVLAELDPGPVPGPDVGECGGRNKASQLRHAPKRLDGGVDDAPNAVAVSFEAGNQECIEVGVEDGEKKDGHVV